MELNRVSGPDLDQLVEQNRPLAEYLDLALKYHQMGNAEAVRNILQVGLENTCHGAEHHRLEALATQAANYVNLATIATDRKLAEEYFDRASFHLSEADKIDNRFSISCLCRGMLILEKPVLASRQELFLAIWNFDSVLEQIPHSIPALMGKARAEYRLGNYRNSLELCRQVVCSWKDCPVGIRVHMGMCFFKLGNNDSAEKWFQRVLEIDPQNVDALIGLATIDLNSMRLSTAYSRLLKAYEFDPQRPTILCHLANHFFFRRDYAKAEPLGIYALSQAKDDSTRALGSFILGKVHHAQNNYDKAFRFYLQTVKLDPGHVPGLFCLAQMHVHRSEWKQAAECLQKILEQRDYGESTKLLGYVYRQNKMDQEKNQLYMQAIKKYPDEFEIMVEYASTVYAKDHEKALEWYSRALERPEAGEFGAELYNNMGVMFYRQDSHKASQESLQRAQIECEAKGEASEYHGKILTTIKFNLARLYEEKCQWKNATDMYKQVLKREPGYVDCYLRLGMLELRQERALEAEDLLKEAIGMDSSRKETWQLLAYKQWKVKAINPARKSFERVLTTVDKHDHYSLLFVGNIYLQLARYEARGSKPWNHNLGRATEFFQKCLMLDSRNYYALNGLGIVCAMRGYLKQIRPLFVEIKQEEGQFMDAWINLAHTFMEEGNNATALGLYEHCSEKIGLGKDHCLEVLMFLAKAFYFSGKAGFGDHILRSISILQKVLLLNPSDDSIRFNIALCQQEYSNVVLNQTGSTSGEISSAADGLEVAFKIFELLKEPVWTTNPQYDPKVARQRAKFYGSLRSRAMERYEAQKIEEQQQKDKLETLRIKREAERLEEAKQQEDENRRRSEHEQQIQEQRRSAQMRVQELYRTDRQEDESKEAPNRKRTKKAMETIN